MSNFVDSVAGFLLGKRNVVGVGFGEKWVGGVNTGVGAVLVFVSRKEDVGRLSACDVVPGSVGGVVTDVVGRTGVISSLGLTGRSRPVCGGVSCGHLKVSAGTLGGWFLDGDGDVVGLSNNHVLAWENLAKSIESHGDGPTGGHLVFQPGAYDSGDFGNNKVGKLKSFIRLVRGGNVEDSAVLKPFGLDLVEAGVDGVGVPVGFNDDLRVGDLVQKVGRTTGFTTGRVIAVDGVVSVQYSRRLGVLSFRDQVITSAMSAGGDSGSLMLDMGGRVGGLLFAGSSQVTVFNKIKYPRESYGLSIYDPSPLVEDFSYTLVVDGVSEVSGDVGGYAGLLVRARRLAREGRVVSFSVGYSA